MPYAVLAIVIAMVSAGCTSIKLATPRLSPADCATDPALIGTWTSTRMTQVGPGSMRVTFNDDCTFAVRAQLPVRRVNEQGQYRVSGGRIEFYRSSGVTHWPFSFDGPRLLLTESVDEVHAYSRER